MFVYLRKDTTFKSHKFLFDSYFEILLFVKKIFITFVLTSSLFGFALAALGIVLLRSQYLRPTHGMHPPLIYSNLRAHSCRSDFDIA